MARPRTGFHRWRQGLLYAVVSWIDSETGKQRYRERRVPSGKMTDLQKVIIQLQTELDTDLSRARLDDDIDPSTLTFERAARAYAKEHIKPAEIVEGKKIDGLKNWKDPARAVETLIGHFGKLIFGSINADQIKKWKRQRLQTKSARGEVYKVASVNRDLETMRAIYRFGQAKGWVTISPFFGTKIINKADEAERMVILSYEQERALLAQCKPPRAHLRPFLIVSIDTFMRKGELFKLRKEDVDLERRIIEVRATNTKTERPRRVGLTDRAHAELSRLVEFLEPGDLVFTLGSVKRSFATACRLAGISGLRIHDLRHTGITRRLEAVVRARLPWHIVMKEAGHTQMKTFMKYFNPDIEVLRRAAEAMAELHSANQSAEVYGSGFEHVQYSDHVN